MTAMYLKTKKIKLEGWRADLAVVGLGASLVMFIIGVATTLRETFWLMYTLYKLATGMF